MYRISLSTKRLAFFVAGGFLAIVAIFLGVEQMYLMAIVMLLTPVVALWVGRLMLRGLTVTRHAASTCIEGEEVQVRLSVTNETTIPRLFIKPLDVLPEWFNHIGSEGELILQIDPDETRTIGYKFEPVKRGVFQIGPVLLTGTDPFGLFTSSRAIPVTNEIVVYPRPLPISVSVISAGDHGWRGEDEGLRRGSGLDFHGVREYRQGDELRRVHWRTTARTGKLSVAEYNQGEALDVLIALDLNEEAYRQSGIGKESALEYAVKIAATLCDCLTRNNHMVQLITTSLGEGSEPVTNDGHSSLPLLAALACVDATSTTSLAELLSYRRNSVNRGLRVIYLTPNVDDPQLSLVLSDYTALGALPSGFAFDASSFHPVPRMRARNTTTIYNSKKNTQEEAPHKSNYIGPVRSVKRGDDLSEAILDLLTGRSSFQAGSMPFVSRLHNGGR